MVTDSQTHPQKHTHKQSNTQTHRQVRLQYTAPLSLACSVKICFTHTLIKIILQNKNLCGCRNTPSKVLCSFVAISNNWMAPWKNQICSTTMKLRKSLVKPVMRQKTCNYIELFSSSITHDDACYSLNVCRYMRRAWHLWWKNRTTRYNCRFSATSLALRVIFVHWKRPPICVVHDDIGWKNQTTRYNRFWRAGCSQLEYVDIRSVY